MKQLLRGYRFRGSFDEVAVDERRASADEGDEGGALIARERSWAASTGLKAMAKPAVRLPGPS